MLTRQQIRQFLAVVDTGNFSRAADAIGVTQPTLSSGIAELEGHVGARLFERQRPTVRRLGLSSRLTPRIDRPPASSHNTACCMAHPYQRRGAKHCGRREQVA